MHGLLNQAVEQFAAMFRGPTIEPEREFVEVIVEMLATDRTLMSAQQPPFEKRRYPDAPAATVPRPVLHVD